MHQLHLTIEKIIAFGLLIYAWNHLGLSPKATLIGNIIAAALLIIFVWFV